MPLTGTLRVPGDKSISHRCLMLGALSEGVSHFSGLLDGEDVRSTARCLQQLGVNIDFEAGRVHGVGLSGLKSPAAPLDCGNSGTTFRLLMGILAAQPFASTLTGDVSLSKRPMTRVAQPLNGLGANITLTREKYPPVTLEARTTPLRGGSYALPIASAQVKSALLLAGLYSQEPVVLSGRLDSRDHTEKMLPAFGVQLEQGADHITLPVGQKLTACDFSVPGDPSSAAFWLAAAAMVPGSEITLEQVSLNATRICFFEVLKGMGAEISWKQQGAQTEPMGQVHLRYAPLKAVTLEARDIPFLVDEVPLIALLGTQAEGTTRVRGAEELRVKECDRLAAMGQNLQSMGAIWKDYPDGFDVTGKQPLQGSKWTCFHDHRIAMTGVLAGLVVEGNHQIDDPDCIAVSYPGFMQDLNRLQS